MMAVIPYILYTVAHTIMVIWGVLLWRKEKWGWVFFPAVLVFIGEVVPIEWVRRLIGSGFEVLFMVGMLWTDRWLLYKKN